MVCITVYCHVRLGLCQTHHDSVCQHTWCELLCAAMPDLDCVKLIMTVSVNIHVVDYLHFLDLTLTCQTHHDSAACINTYMVCYVLPWTTFISKT